MTMAGPSDVGESGHVGSVDRSPNRTPMMGEPHPRRAEQQLAGQEHGHARRQVVPADDDLIEERRVDTDEHGHGIGLGKRAGPGPRRRGAHAEHDDDRAEQHVTHGAAPRRRDRPPTAGRLAFPQG